MLQISKSTLRASSIVAAVGMVAMGLVQTSQAAPSTFAQFNEAPDVDGSNLFSYINTPAATGPSIAELVSDPAEAATGIPVTFSFLNLPGLPADLQGVQDATLTLTSSTESTVQTGFGGVVLEQDITGIPLTNDVLTITRDTPAAEGGGSKTNLLTVDFTGELIGAMNSRTPQLSGDTNEGDTVVYSSDFVGFANGTNDYSLTFSSWTSTDSAGSGLIADPSDNFYTTATAAGAGTFDATVIPEPSSLALGGLLLILGRRNRFSKAL